MQGWSWNSVDRAADHQSLLGTLNERMKRLEGFLKRCVTSDTTETAYETGTWTPTLVGGTGAGSYTVGVLNSSAHYTKVGRIVRVSAFLSITENSAGTGNAVFGGLPYAKAANSTFVGSMATSSVNLSANCVQINPLPLSAASSASTFGIAETFDNAGVGLLPVTALTTGSQLHVAFEYIV